MRSEEKVKEKLASILAYLDKFEAIDHQLNKNGDKSKDDSHDDKENVACRSIKTQKYCEQKSSFGANDNKVLGDRNILTPIHGYKGQNASTAKQTKQWIWDTLDDGISEDILNKTIYSETECDPEAIVEKGTCLKHKIDTMQSQLSAFDKQYMELQKTLLLVQHKGTDEINKITKSWKEREQKQVKDTKASTERNHLFVKKLEEDTNMIKEKVEAVHNDIKKIKNAKLKLCASEESRGKATIELIQKSLNEQEKERLRKLEKSKTLELKHAIAASLEPEILKVVSDNKTEEEKLKQKHQKCLEEHQRKCTEDNEVRYLQQIQKTEETCRKETEELRSSHNSIILGLTKQYDHDFKLAQENHIKDLNKQREAFETKRKEIVDQHIDEIETLQKSERDEIKVAQHQHEVNLRSIEDKHNLAINDAHIIEAENEAGRKESRLLELTRASDVILSKEIDRVKLKLKADIERIREKLKLDSRTNKERLSDEFFREVQDIKQRYKNETEKLRNKEDIMKEKHHGLSIKLESLTQLLISTENRATHSLEKLSILQNTLRDKGELIKNNEKESDVKLAEKVETYEHALESVIREIKILEKKRGELHEKLLNLPAIHLSYQNEVKVNQETDLGKIKERMKIIMTRKDRMIKDSSSHLETLRRKTEQKNIDLDAARRKKYEVRQP